MRNLKEESESQKQKATDKNDEKNELEKELLGIQTAIQKLDAIKSNGENELRTYKEYKHFIDEIAREVITLLE